MNRLDDLIGTEQQGVVKRVGPSFGFITCEVLQSEDLFFSTTWFRDAPPLRTGERVKFRVAVSEGKAQAHEPSRVEAGGSQSSGVPSALEPRGYWLTEWAYIGHIPQTLEDLAQKALQEDWEFRKMSPDPDRPRPILYSCLLNTFGRLVREHKIMISSDRKLASFNTGLVDHRYEPIYAVFELNQYGDRLPWRFRDFCIAGEGGAGQSLVRSFAPLPKLAHYFDKPSDLIYDTRSGKPECNWDHIVVERISRYPQEFLEDHWPSGLERQSLDRMHGDDKNPFWDEFGEAVRNDARVYRGIINRIKDAVDLSVKRVAWNFKTAIPTYYPRVGQLQLLLPLCLLSDDQVDLALAVERTPAGGYLAHTVLPLDWAYKNARLVCRPDSDWLSPEDIAVGSGEEDV